MVARPLVGSWRCRGAGWPSFFIYRRYNCTTSKSPLLTINHLAERPTFFHTNTCGSSPLVYRLAGWGGRSCTPAGCSLIGRWCRRRSRSQMLVADVALDVLQTACRKGSTVPQRLRPYTQRLPPVRAGHTHSRPYALTRHPTHCSLLVGGGDGGEIVLGGTRSLAAAGMARALLARRSTGHVDRAGECGRSEAGGGSPE